MCSESTVGMRNNLIFCHNQAVVSVVTKQYFFCQNHDVVNVVAIGTKSLFLFQVRGVLNVVLKRKNMYF